MTLEMSNFIYENMVMRLNVRAVWFLSRCISCYRLQFVHFCQHLLWLNAILCRTFRFFINFILHLMFHFYETLPTPICIVITSVHQSQLHGIFCFCFVSFAFDRTINTSNIANIIGVQLICSLWNNAIFIEFMIHSLLISSIPMIMFETIAID